MRGPELPSSLRTSGKEEGSAGERLTSPALTCGLRAAACRTLPPEQGMHRSPRRWLLSCPQPRPVGQEGAARRPGGRILLPAWVQGGALFTSDPNSVPYEPGEQERPGTRPGAAAAGPRAEGAAAHGRWTCPRGGGGPSGKRPWLASPPSSFWRLKAGA